MVIKPPILLLINPCLPLQGYEMNLMAQKKKKSYTKHNLAFFSQRGHSRNGRAGDQGRDGFS